MFNSDSSEFPDESRTALICVLGANGSPVFICLIVFNRKSIFAEMNLKVRGELSTKEPRHNLRTPRRNYFSRSHIYFSPKHNHKSSPTSVMPLMVHRLSSQPDFRIEFRCFFTELEM